MKDSHRLKRYVVLSTLPALAVLALAVLTRGTLIVPVLVWPLVLLITTISETYRVELRQSLHTLSSTAHMAFALLLPPMETLLFVVGGVLASNIFYYRRRRLVVLYNVVVRVLSVGVPSLLLSLWYHQDARFSDHAAFLTPSLARSGQLTTNLTLTLEVSLASAGVAALYILSESALIASVISVQTKTDLLNSWQVNLRAGLLPELAKSMLGIMAAWLFVSNPFYILFALLPIAIAHFMLQAVVRLDNETIEAITALADSIDARDPATARHSERVAALARRLAQGMRLPGDEVEQITLAARVHDLGKMSVSNDVLLKEGPLDGKELDEMQQHPAKGAAVLSRYRNFKESIPIVLHHHERHDGKGYPHGIKGAEIPRGAMIIAHADTYDAMVSDRPYRRGLAPDVALTRIIEAAGSQFDPAVTVMFIALIKEDLAAQGYRFPADDEGSLSSTETEEARKRSAVLPMRRRDP